MKHIGEMFAPIIAAGVPFVAPYAGAILIAVAVEDASDGGATAVWRILLPVGIGIFVTLVGVIYKNQEKKFDGVAERFVAADKRFDQINTDVTDRIERVAKRNQQILSTMLSIVLASQGKGTEAKLKIIQKILEEQMVP